MYKDKLHRISKIIGLVLGMLVMTACSQPTVSQPVQEQGGFVKIAPGAYDSADTAIVVEKQEAQKKITFLNLKKKKNYTLNYDGITKFTDKYGSQISVGQLEEGEVVDVQFLKEEKLISSLAVSSSIWTLNDVSKFELDLNAGKIKIMNEYYTLDDTTVVFSGGEKVEFTDISSQDVLKIKGVDHKIYSITIDAGHGYLKLKNEEYFVGGWIEVGQKIIYKIEEDMILTVPEGTYDVYLSHTAIEGTKKAEIKRNQETLLDVGDLKKEDLIKYGSLTIKVDPSNASVYVDENLVDTSRIIKATYGLHQITAKAQGYDTVTQYVRINEDGAKVTITLDEEAIRSVSENSVSASDKNKSNTEEIKEKQESTTQKKDTTVSENSVSANSVSANSTEKKEDSKNKTSTTVSGSSIENTSAETSYKVTIESPNGAEAYVDGNYVGIIPASFPKKTGSHEITIRKTGYLTRTYTINVDEEKKDISYSFSDLTPIDQ